MRAVQSDKVSKHMQFLILLVCVKLSWQHKYQAKSERADFAFFFENVSLREIFLFFFSEKVLDFF